MRFASLLTSAAVCSALATLAAAGATVGWRLDGTGHFPEAKPPVQWGPAQNVVWKTPLPVWSNASPVLVGDRLFVCAEPATLICVAATDGKILWQKSVTPADVLPEAEAKQAAMDEANAAVAQKRVQDLENQIRQNAEALKKTPDDAALKVKGDEVKVQLEAAKKAFEPLRAALPAPTHPINGFSSMTPVSDGKRVFQFFGNGWAAAFDLEGKRLWATLVEKPTHGWGNCASPVLVGNVVVFHVTNVFGVDADTGKVLWRAPSGTHFGSPVVVHVGDTDAVVTACGEVIRVRDGQVLYKGLALSEYCAPVAHGDVVYFIDGEGRPARAIKLPAVLDGTTPPEKLWDVKLRGERYYSSPLWHDGLLYCVCEPGWLTVLDAQTGQSVYTQKLELKGSAWTSVTRAGPYLYIGAEGGATVIIEPGRVFKQVAVNQLESFRTTPLFSGNRMYIRGLQNLYCIGGLVE